ncbi:hypothetical protein HZS_5428 [Henneguya salminicola]|nr:hypothetical protein HZS_5428 [Henneguya salminicola]
MTLPRDPIKPKIIKFKNNKAFMFMEWESSPINDSDINGFVLSMNYEDKIINKYLPSNERNILIELIHSKPKSVSNFEQENTL